MKLLGLLLLVACAHGAVIPAPAQPGDENAKLVRALEPYASELAWRQSAYYRLGDFSWPWYLVVATDGTACALFTNTVFLPQVRDYYACPNSWRLPRP